MVELLGTCTKNDMWASVQYLYHELVYNCTEQYKAELAPTVLDIIGS